MATQLANAGVRIRILVFLNLDPCLSLGLFRNDWILSTLLPRVSAQSKQNSLALAPPSLGFVGPCLLGYHGFPATGGLMQPFSVSGADPEETILNAFKVFDPEGKGVLRAD